VTRRRSTGTAGLAAALLALAVAGCGAPPADLFVVQRTGSVPGANLKLLASDGSVRCNDGPERDITSSQLLTARGIADDLADVHQSDVAASRPVIFAFRVRYEQGSLRFADTTTRPAVLPRLVRFTRDMARGVCHLPR
jgi:hypothetical protein